ncbi:hypothetical protein [Hydrogenophaga sp.]|uniref:hypothetical protein n=1 Tax=Hydrogenophaga sp. TaxID=1904254 RepID=UPI0026034582|nr:hypothetical protein [Hydrogenophaga sp.]MDM7951422.1 hypothetical protein [Hydrogenophaga sp.]
MFANLFWGGLGALLVWIGWDTFRGGNWWKRLPVDQQDAVIGLPSALPNEANQDGRVYLRNRFGGFLSASPLMGLAAALAGAFMLAFSVGLIE